MSPSPGWNAHHHARVVSDTHDAFPGRRPSGSAETGGGGMARVQPKCLGIFENNEPTGRMMALVNYNADLAEY